MRAPILASALVTTLAVVAWVSAEEPKGGASQNTEAKAAYWKDPRLEAELRFPDGRRARPPDEGVFTQPLPKEDADGDPNAPLRVIRLVAGRVLPASDVLKTLKEKTGVTVLLAGEWCRQSLAVPTAGGPVRELMDAMAQAFNAHWFQPAKDTWVLARGQTEAMLAAMPEEKRYAGLRDSTRALFGSLDSGRWKVLANGEPLTVQMLTPTQREAVLQGIRLQYYDPNQPKGNEPTAAAAAGYGVTLTLQGMGKDAGLQIQGPGQTGRFSVLIPFYNPTNGQLMWGVPPPR